MNITSVKVTLADNTNSKLLAYADVTINDCIAIHSIKIIKGDNKNFIAFPSIRKTNKDGNGFVYSDIVHPLNQETRSKFEDAIFEEYNKIAE